MALYVTLFGCTDCKDEILHYLQFPILWQLAREALLLSVEHFSIGHRLCFIDCSRDRRRLLAYSHTLYHALKNHRECVNALGMVKDSQFIQQRSCHLIKALRPFVS